MSAFEWDAEKAAANLEKHNVDFADVTEVFNDEMAITAPDAASDEEERFMTIGSDSLGRVVVVAYSWRGSRVRLISARLASRRERLTYEGKRR